ncbi:MAG: crossover junction endodeoxyribonuclease RuvC [Pseudomonadota bacterium]
MEADRAIVLGIDPGSHITGFGVITQVGSRLIHLTSGVLKAPSKGPFERRLLAIHDQLSKVIRETSPTAVAVEAVFFAKNVRSVVSLAHARGVALLVAAQHGIPVYEYSPMEVKRAVVGYGRASKEQTAEMIGRLFRIPREENETIHDRTDALAVALCHLNSARTHERIHRSEVRTAALRGRIGREVE